MTTTATHSFVGPLTANGVTPLPFDFQAISDDEIEVTRNGVVVSISTYTVDLQGDGTGEITPLDTWGTDEVYIYSKPNWDQPVNFTRFTPVYPDQFNFPLDRLTRMMLALRTTVTQGLANLSSMIVTSVGGTPTVSSRTTLALIDADNAPAVFLREGGRSGLFWFEPTNLAAKVTADPQQGIYVAPQGQTGSAGAWVRQYDGRVNVRWFGAVGDGVTNDGPAAIAAIAFLKTTKLLGYGYGSGSADLFIPASHYFLGTHTLDLTHTIRLTGEGMGHNGGSSTVLRWAAGATGIRVQAYNTTGATGVIASPPDNTAGSGSTIEKLFLKGGMAGVEGEFHGIHLRAMATIRDVFIDNFQGDGIHATAAAGTGGAIEGNANLVRVRDCAIRFCRNGIFMDNADANAGDFLGVNVDNNRMWGVWDTSFLGNTYTGLHAAANGWDGAIGSIPTACTYLGNRYFVRPGQAAGASVNAPSGTTVFNTWWGYIGPGGAYNGIAPWVSGTTFREGGCFKTDDPNATTVFTGCYIEGDQNPAQVNAPAIIVGGNLMVSNQGTAMAVRSTSDGDPVLGYTSGPQRNLTMYYDSTNVSVFQNYRFWGAITPGVAYDGGSLWNAGGNMIYTFPGYQSWRVNNVEKMKLTGTEFNLVDVPLQRNGLQVVGARGAALPADATDLASVIALANAIKARMKATGGHGLVAD